VGVVSVAMHDEAIVSTELRAPFPWFGGKRRVAPLVWSRLGDVDSYNEPFAGGLSVLLGRPTAPRVETVNDLDCFLANFWRALQFDPDGVAYWCDGPVNEADLHARHRWLVARGRRLVARCLRDPHYFNAKVAGWWVWGQCLWIGSGWCQRPEWTGRVNAGRRARGVHVISAAEEPSEHLKRPRLYDHGGAGVHSNRALAQKRPLATGNGQGCGVHRRWQGGGQGGGSGVHAPRLTQQMPRIAAEGGSISGVTASPLVESGGLYDYLGALGQRLRRVRVCCGDWKRVLTPSVTTYVGLTGVFLDPPYDHDLRERCYAEDHNISADVRAWAIEHGDDPKMRIALCGYQDEHGPHMPSTWEKVAWKAHGGYSRTERGVANRDQERIWFSPHCLKPGENLFSLFDNAGADEAGAVLS
jgi:DNA adenine methylase